MRILLLSTLAFSLSLTGCGMSPTAEPTPETGAAIQGRVHGGQQPIAGASIYLYAAGTSGYGGSSISLLNSNVLTNNPSNSGRDGSGNYYVTTDSSGNFSIGSDYTCTSGQQVYLYAVGGNPGAGANSAAGLLAILGTCPVAGNFAAATPFVFIDEVSTIAAAYAFSGYATDATHVSSSGTTLAQLGIANAFANAANLENLATGVAYSTTPAGNATVPQTTINTLANILAACINSTGPTSSACSTLFTNMLSTGATGVAATDTATAAIYLAHNPGVNVSTLFAIPTPSAPFSPTLPTSPTPNDFTLGLNFTGGGLSEPIGIAIDGSGNAWVTDFTGKSVTEISSSGSFLSGANGYTGGGLNNPYGIAIDLNGSAWVANQGGASVTEISSSGSFLSGLSGYTANSGFNLPRAIAVDALNNVWIANYVGNNIVILNNAGSVLSGQFGYTGSSQDFIYFPMGMAIGPDGSAWIVNANGNNVTRLDIHGNVLSGQLGYTGGGLKSPNSIAIDNSGNGWISNPSNIPTGNGSITNISSTGAILSGSGGYTGGNLFEPDAVAIDGAGNVWVANQDGNDFTEISNTGAYLSGANAYKGGSINRPYAIAVDGSGNVWTANSFNNVTELIGAATPVVTPLVVGVKNNTLGTRP